MAMMRDVVTPGISSAVSFKQAKEQLKLLSEQTREAKASADMAVDERDAMRWWTPHPSGEFVMPHGPMKGVRHTSYRHALKMAMMEDVLARAGTARSVADLNRVALPGATVRGKEWIAYMQSIGIPVSAIGALFRFGRRGKGITNVIKMPDGKSWVPKK